jgi:hypothetical protein
MFKRTLAIAFQTCLGAIKKELDQILVKRPTNSVKTNSGDRIMELFAEIDSIKITVLEITSFEAGRIRAIYTNISKLERIHDKAVVKMDKLGGAHGMIFGEGRRLQQ